MKYFYLMAAMLGVAAIFVLFNPFALAGQNNLQVTFLDVGQGDSILIETPEGQNVLIDGGPDKSVVRELNKALPFWEREIDLILLTHSHADHVTGLNSVLKRFDVGKVLYNGRSGNSEVYKYFLQTARKKSDLCEVREGQKVRFGEDCELEIIYTADKIGEVENLNNASIVSKLDCEGKTALFTGDIEKEVEERLARGSKEIQSKILKVSHHGSHTSNNSEFLKKVNPSLGVIQVGKDNDMGHPSSLVLSRLKRQNVLTLRNDLRGTIELDFKGGETQVNFLH